MGRYLLKGHVSYAVKKKYKWIAEFGKNTCKQCAALDGQEFDEDDVPYWPHPNCRCKVEEISEIDEIESEINEYKEELEQLNLQANELLGDTRVLREQIEKAIKESQIKEANTLEAKLTRLEYDIYRLLDKIEKLTIETIDKFVIEKIQKEIEEIKDGVLNKTKEQIDLVVNKTEHVMPELHDAAGFWNISSDMDEKGVEYLNMENGKIIETLNDLGSNNLQNFIKDKLKSQNLSQNTIGVSFDKNSSVALDIARSQEFKKFIHDNKENLINNRSIKDNYLVFQMRTSLNLYLAIKHSDIINIYIDSNNTLHATVIDTYDFNKGEWDPIVKITYNLQKNGKIIPYYSVIKIELPEILWTQY